MHKYSISDLEKFSGIKAHTIRMWERRYGVINPNRTQTNIRYYSEDDLMRLLNISILKQIGYRISKIANLSNEDLKNYVITNIIEADNPEVHIETLVISMFSFDEYRFLKVLNGTIEKNGIEYTFEKVVMPLIDRLGLLCNEGMINPVQRNFIFNLIRQKLIVAIDELDAKEIRELSRRIIFFMPSAEWAEVILLYYSLIARMEGFEVLYLGTSIELDALKSGFDIREDDILFFSVNDKCTDDELKKVVPFLNENFEGALKIISGLNMKQKLEKIAGILKNSKIVSSAGAFRSVVESINKK